MLTRSGAMRQSHMSYMKPVTANTKTLGARIKLARVSCDMTQENFANAIALLTKTRCNKSLVSKWEAESAVPVVSTLAAISSVTGYSLEWLSTGTGPERARPKKLRIEERTDASRAIMRRAVAIAHKEQRDPLRVADAIIEIFEMLADDPNIPDAALRRIAQLAH